MKFSIITAYIFGLIICSSILSSTTSLANTTPNNSKLVAQYSSTIETLNDYLIKHSKNNSFPRFQKDATVKSLILEITNEKKYIDTLVKSDDTESLLAICEAIAKVSTKYTLQGTHIKSPDEFSYVNRPPQQDQIVLKNLINFHNEMSYILPFAIRCSAEIAQTIEKNWQYLKQEEKVSIRNDFLEMQLEMTAYYSSSFHVYFGKKAQVSQREQKRILDSLIRNFDNIVTNLPKTRRAQIIYSIWGVPENIKKAYKTELEAMYLAYKNAPCNELCRYLQTNAGPEKGSL